MPKKQNTQLFFSEPCLQKAERCFWILTSQKMIFLMFISLFLPLLTGTMNKPIKEKSNNLDIQYWPSSAKRMAWWDYWIQSQTSFIVLVCKKKKRIVLAFIRLCNTLLHLQTPHKSRIQIICFLLWMLKSRSSGWANLRVNKNKYNTSY